MSIVSNFWKEESTSLDGFVQHEQFMQKKKKKKKTHKEEEKKTFFQSNIFSSD